MGDEPRDEEVQGRAAAVPEDGVEEVRERLAPDEERQRLVLVRRPSVELHGEEGRRGDRTGGDPGRQEPLRPVDCSQEVRRLRRLRGRSRRGQDRGHRPPEATSARQTGW
jgi:hypothetical protein